MDKSEIIGTLLFVNSQYWVCAIIARIGFAITGMSKLMTPGNGGSVFWASVPPFPCRSIP